MANASTEGNAMPPANDAADTGSSYSGVKRVAYLNSSAGRCCEHCDRGVGLLSPEAKDISDAINHYIQAHGYKLLHIGTESSRDHEGALCHSTVAILGAENPPQMRPETEEIIGDK